MTRTTSKGPLALALASGALTLEQQVRNIGPGNTDGRQHTMNHQSLSIGKPFRGGVIGGVVPLGGDYGCLPITSATGAGSASGDIPALQTLGSFGVDSSVIAEQITTGKVVAGALA